MQDEAWKAEQIRRQADILLAGDALGRSQALEPLFRYLLSCSLEGRTPKEIEIGDEVFGRSASSTDQDASIRVYIHRLRRKLDEYYAGPGAGEPVRLVLPKGGYRLTVEPMAGAVMPEPIAEPAAADVPAPAPALAARLRPLLAGIAALIAVMLLALWLAPQPGPIDIAMVKTQDSILWRSAASNARPVIIVVGDYYLIGERDQGGQITRLIREFDVNSPRDLERLKSSQPERAGNYVDLGLNYLPLGVGNALRRVIPVVTKDKQSLITLRVVPASRLTPDMVKYNDIVYIGYLSGLGSLRDPVFSGSRYAIGASYDEIIDRRTRKAYVSGTHLENGDEKLSQDYALISTFFGVTGNRIVIIAGTRDAALMQAAEFACRSAMLAQITGPLNGAPAFEALLVTESLNNEGLRARVLTTSARAKDADWSGRPPQRFPDDADDAATAAATP